MLPALIALAAAVTWLAYEFATAPVVDDDTGPDPWLAEEVRAALNAIDGYPIHVPPAAERHASLGGTSTGPGHPHAGVGHFGLPLIHNIGE